MAHVHIDPDGELHGVVVIWETEPGAPGAYEISDDLWRAIDRAQDALESLHREALWQTGILPDPDTTKEQP